MVVKGWFIAVLTAILVVLVGCAPRATPVPTPTPVSPLAAPAAPTLSAPSLSPEEAAWSKVVETARKEGKLTIYSYFTAGDTGIKVREAFSRRTGLNLEIVTGTGALFMERIKAERRASTQMASVLDTASGVLLQAKLDGLTQPVGYLPILTDESVWEKSPRADKEGHILFTGPLLQTPWVNTKLLKREEEPRSWRELLQPQWREKIDFPNPDTNPSSVLVYYYLNKYAGLDDLYFRQLGKQVKYSLTSGMGAEALARGDAPVSFFQNAVSIGRFIKEGAPVKAIDMEEGVVGLQTSGLVFLQGAPHPNAARVYINWLLSQEGQTVLHQYNGDSSFRKDVPDFKPPAARITPRKTIWATPEEDLAVVPLQRDRVLTKLMTQP